MLEQRTLYRRSQFASQFVDGGRKEGQRWLYAGPATSQPSVLLKADANSATSSDFGRFQRVDDARARFPSEWQSCAQNAQCEPVPIGCQRTAANSANAAAARAPAI